MKQNTPPASDPSTGGPAVRKWPDAVRAKAEERAVAPGAGFAKGAPGQRRGRGFTLLEVMIAVAILAVTLVTVYRSQSQSIAMVSNSRFLTTASLLAQARMARIDAVDTRQVASAKGDFGEEFPGYFWQMDIGEVKDLPLLRKISLTVTNGRMAANNTYRLVLYKVILP